MTEDQFAAAAWSLQQRVNLWFRENESWRKAGTNLMKLTERGLDQEFSQMTSDPDGDWYETNGHRPESRAPATDMRNESFWRAIEPLYDFLHSQYRVAWTYSVLMLQANENFRGTVSNLGIGDHFSARAEVIFSGGKGLEVRPGWHANQLPPFLVQQLLTLRPPFELISTYALNVRYLTDGVPLTFTRSHDEEEPSARDRRIVSVAPFYEIFENNISELTRIVESADIHYAPETGWGHGGVEKLKSIFVEIDQKLGATLRSARALRILNANDQNIFRILSEGPDPSVVAELKIRLSRPENRNLALAKYLVLMNAVWPEWTRITMIPHPVPILSHPQPGGIVICEDAHSEHLNAAKIRKVAELVSIAIWPWVSLQGGARRAEEAMRNAALLGEVVRHDLSNSLSPVRVLLLKRDSRLDATDLECAGYLSRLNILGCSLDGLCGLEDSPYMPKREDFHTMFSRFREAFSGNSKAAFKIESNGNLPTNVPRLYYAVFAELIRNAAKRRPKNWPAGQPSIVITAHQEDAELIITLANAAANEDVDDALEVFRKSVVALSEQARMNLGSELFRKGIGLVVSLVRHARGNLDCHAETDSLGRRWLRVSIRIS